MQCGDMPAPAEPPSHVPLLRRLERLHKAGWLGPAPHPLNAQVRDHRGRPEALWTHPVADVADDPQLWWLCDSWRLGYYRSPEAGQLAELSGWAVHALSEMRAAELARLKGGDDG